MESGTRPHAGTNAEPLPALLDLGGRTALVTGAAAGIGRAIARRLAEAGADLVLVDRSEAGLEAVRGRLEPLGCRIATHVVDLGERPAIERLWAALEPDPPDTLVNNAGIYPGRAFRELDDAFYRRVLAVNLDAVVWTCREMIRRRERRGGVIVNLASVEAVLPFKGDLAIYGASKAAVIALTRALAREHARHGFRINAVLPGGIVTPGTARVARDVLQLRPGLVKAGWDFRQRLPAGRLGKPDEVARVVLFLVSDLAAYVHGAAVPVDGGFLSA